MATSYHKKSQAQFNKLMIAFVGVSTLVFLTILLVVITPKINKIFSDLKQQSQDSSTAVFASQLNQYIKDRELATDDIANNDSLTRELLSHNQNDPSFKDYLNNITLLGEDSQFTILDIEGEVFYNQSRQGNYRWAAAILNDASKPNIQLTIENKKPYFQIAVPIYYGKSTEGVLISKIDASPEAALGNTVANTDDIDIIYQANGVMVELGNNNISKPVITYTELSDYPIILTHITSQKAFNKGKTDLLLGLLISALAGVLIAFLLLLWVGKKLISEPYKNLANTEQQLSQTVDELQEANTFQELINESTPDLIFVKDSDFKIVKANANFLALYPPEMDGKIIGHTTLESYKEEEREVFLTMDKKAFAEGYSEVVETITFPDGEVRSLYTQKIRFENRQKQAFILGLARDVTDREREAELLNKLSGIAINNSLTTDEKIQSALRYSLVYFNLSLAIVSKIHHETYTVAYTTAEESVLKPGDQFKLSDTYCSFVYQNGHVQSWHHAGDSSIASHPCYTTFQLESYIGTTLYVDNQAYGTLNFSAPGKRNKAFSDREKTFISMIAQWVGYQLSSQKNAEKKEAIIKQLTQSNEQLEQFAYICSHDLQEPLRMVASFSELLNEHLSNTNAIDDKSQRYLGFLLDGASRAKELIRDILDYSKLDKDTIRPEPVALTSLVEKIKESIDSHPTELKALIEYQELPTVIGNRTQLYQLFQNLINNGIKYQAKDSEPHIKISVSDGGEQWIFTVSDNGIGIDAAHQTKIFEIFKRLHGRNEYAGTGIGLSICKKIVEGHGGNIWVESTPGQGSDFHFSLPKSANIKHH